MGPSSSTQLRGPTTVNPLATSNPQNPPASGTQAPSVPTQPRRDLHFQALGIDIGVKEGWWLGRYDSIIGGRSLFFGPEEANFNGRLNFHFGVSGYDFFAALGGAHSTTASLQPDGSMSRFDAEFGLTNYRGYRSLVGHRGQGFYLGLSGVSRAGLGLGLAWLNGGSATQSHSVMGQIRPISDGDHLTTGFGPVELGIRLFEGNTAINLGSGNSIERCNGLHCNESDFIPQTTLRGPVFSLRYYFNRPYAPENPPVRLDDQEFLFRTIDLSMSRFSALYRNINQSNIIHTMGVLQGWPLGHDTSQSQYGNALTGLFLLSAINGAGAGSDAVALADSWRRGTGTQTGISMGIEGVWLVASAIGWGFRGSYPTPDAFARGERGAFDATYANGFRLMFPRQAATDGLALLDYSGALGRPEGSTAPWFHVANTLLALTGGAFVLFARPISGNGGAPDGSSPGRPQSLLPNSLLGDYSGTFEGQFNGTGPDGRPFVNTYQWLNTGNNFYDLKQNEVIVTELGAALLSFSINRWLLPRPASGSTASQQVSQPRQTAGIVQNPNLSLNAGSQGVRLNFSGEF